MRQVPSGWEVAGGRRALPAVYGSQPPVISRGATSPFGGFFMSKFTTRRLVTDAVLTALFFVLSLYSIPALGLKFTFDSLPVVLATLLFGPLDGFLVAFLGMFIQQMMQYGFTVTTLLWMLAPALRGLVLGLLMKTLRGVPQVKTAGQYTLYFVYAIFAGIVVSLGNTTVLYIDSKLFHYYSYAMVFGAMTVRVLSGMLFSVITAAIAIPIVMALRRAGLTKKQVF